jgi:hypothetical protein
LTPRYELCPLGVKLSPRGEDPLFTPSFFYVSVHPWNNTTRRQSSPLGKNSTPSRCQLMLLKTGLCMAKTARELRSNLSETFLSCFGFFSLKVERSSDPAFYSILAIRDARFFRHNIPKRGGICQITTLPNGHKIYQMAVKYTKWPLNIPNGHKIYQHFPF